MLEKIGFSVLILVAGISAFSLAGEMSHQQSYASTKVEPASPELPELTADTWGLFDPATGVLFEGSGVRTARPIASVTKLFTATAVLEAHAEETTTIINWNDLYTEGRAGKLSHGEYRTLGELLFPLLLESSNDAGEAIRRTMGNQFGSELDVLIDTLSLSDTRIADGSGLGSTNVSTVDDLARFFTYLKHTHPRILEITKLPMYLTEDTGWVNNNPLRELSGFAGGKHGYTPEADRTFVGAFVHEDGTEVGVVLLGSTELRTDTEALLKYAEAVN